jgi:outer membrane protein assembly factor BamB
MSRVLAFLTVVLTVVFLGCRDSETGAIKDGAAYTKPLMPVEDSELTDEGLTSSKSSSDPVDSATNWTQFRGPSMLATSPFATVATSWSEDHGIAWKTEIIVGVKTRGASSPVVLGDRVYLTAFSGCGTSSQDREDISELKHHVICFDKYSGKRIWHRTIQGSNAIKRLSEHALGHGYASSTPLIDGNRLYTFFGVSGVFAFDLDGEFLWQTNVGTHSQDFGSSASLAVFEDLLYVNASVENETLYALDKSTGNAVWKLDGVIQSWSTPVVAKTRDGDDELIVNHQDMVRGLDPRTGEELWNCDGIDDYVVATPIVVDGICYVSGGQHHEAMAIKLGGRGDVTDTHKIWRIRKGSNVSSPVYHEDTLYLIATNGILQLIEAGTGKIIHRQRMGNAKEILASPTILGDHMFVPTQHKGVVVMSILDDCQIIARNTFGGDDNPLQASIAVSENLLFLRTDGHIYCVGQAVESMEPVATLESSTEREIVIPKHKYDIDDKTNRPKAFIRALVTEPDAILDFMLIPYKSVITPKQTAKSTEFILANHQTFIDLRQRYLDLTWEYTKGNKTESEYVADLAVIEDLAMKQNYMVRKYIKDMFTEEQMDQHYRDAGIVRKKRKPGS